MILGVGHEKGILAGLEEEPSFYFRGPTWPLLRSRNLEPRKICQKDPKGSCQ